MKLLNILFVFAMITFMSSCATESFEEELLVQDKTETQVDVRASKDCTDRFISQMYIVITAINNYPNGGGTPAITSSWVNTQNVINNCAGDRIIFPTITVNPAGQTDPNTGKPRDCNAVGGGGSCADGTAVLNALDLFQCRLSAYLADPESPTNAQNLQTALCDYLTMVNLCFEIGIDVEFHCQTLLNIT